MGALHFLLLVILSIYLKDESEACCDPYTITGIGERGELLEAPFWDQDAKLLYWVDMYKNKLNSYDPDTGIIAHATIDSPLKPVTLVVRVKDTIDGFLVSLKGALFLIRWDGRSNDILLSPKFFADVEHPNCENRLNDGNVDPSNRLWIGSMGPLVSQWPNVFEKDQGSLYLIGLKGEVSQKRDKLQLSNGLEWSLNADKLYLVDSHAFKLYEFDFNNNDGSIGEIDVVLDLKALGMVEPMNSLPDGMTIDEEGMLWVAVYGTQKIIRVDPTAKKILFEIVIPKALQITSVAFGGENLDILFVTTAMMDWTDEMEQQYPDSGRLFMITGLGIKGLPSRGVIVDESMWENV